MLFPAKPTSPLDGAEARKAVQVVCAMYESAAQGGRPVSIGLAPQNPAAVAVAAAETRPIMPPPTPEPAVPVVPVSEVPMNKMQARFVK